MVCLGLRHFAIALRLASRRPAHTGPSVDTTAFVETTAADLCRRYSGHRLSSSSQTVMTSARGGRVAVRRRAMTLRGSSLMAADYHEIFQSSPRAPAPGVFFGHPLQWPISSSFKM